MPDNTAAMMFTLSPPTLWGGFLVALFLAIRGTYTRCVYLPLVFLVPILLFAYKLPMLFDYSVELLKLYVVSVFLGSVTGFILASLQRISINQRKDAVIVPGHFFYGVLLISFFLISLFPYYFALSESKFGAYYLNFECCIHGFISGALLGRAFGYLRHFRKERVMLFRS